MPNYQPAICCKVHILSSARQWLEGWKSDIPGLLTSNFVSCIYSFVSVDSLLSFLQFTEHGGSSSLTPCTFHTGAVGVPCSDQTRRGHQVSLGVSVYEDIR